MDNHTVLSYERDLSNIRKNILNMISLVKEVIKIANLSLQECKESHVKIAYQTDQKINELDKIIESEATSILALRQPLAIDLRESLSALKISTILERIGDLAKHISSRAEDITIEIDSNILDHITKISNIALGMIEDIIQAYQNCDVNLARTVFSKDQEIDQLYTITLNKLEGLITKNPTQAKSLIQIIYAIKNLERIGDYIAKIAVLINYIFTAEREIK